jgi:hypothetical protein
MVQNLNAGRPFPERLCNTIEDRTSKGGHAVQGLGRVLSQTFAGLSCLRLVVYEALATNGDRVTAA